MMRSLSSVVPMKLVHGVVPALPVSHHTVEVGAYPRLLTNPVVAILVPLSVRSGVGAVGVPVRAGDARRA